ncbi:hypothetical protein CMI37_21105 [Candidatus Pacearchaeota archaeon]|nr:hypothetical protein [Candidatus Pacearchaeota archaeon]|tara:strand:- start:5778 stop:6149 length:372 start_codon:yes stop_codon:yes gene_type:complete
MKELTDNLWRFGGGKQEGDGLNQGVANWELFFETLSDEERGEAVAMLESRRFIVFDKNIVVAHPKARNSGWNIFQGSKVIPIFGSVGYFTREEMAKEYLGYLKEHFETPSDYFLCRVKEIPQR